MPFFSNSVLIENITTWWQHKLWIPVISWKIWNNNTFLKLIFVCLQLEALSSYLDEPLSQVAASWHWFRGWMIAGFAGCLRPHRLWLSTSVCDDSSLTVQIVWQQLFPIPCCVNVNKNYQWARYTTYSGG